MLLTDLLDHAVLCVVIRAGHNGCLDDFSHMRSCNPKGLLCRKSFDPHLTCCVVLCCV
mgnify:CR=1 FL=1